MTRALAKFDLSAEGVNVVSEEEQSRVISENPNYTRCSLCDEGQIRLRVDSSQATSHWVTVTEQILFEQDLPVGICGNKCTGETKENMKRGFWEGKWIKYKQAANARGHRKRQNDRGANSTNTHYLETSSKQGNNDDANTILTFDPATLLEYSTNTHYLETSSKQSNVDDANTVLTFDAATLLDDSGQDEAVEVCEPTQPLPQNEGTVDDQNMERVNAHTEPGKLHAETERLRIYYCKEGDVDEYYEFLYKHKKVMEKYATGEPWTFEYAKTRVEGWANRWRNGDPFSAFTVREQGTNKFLGTFVLGGAEEPDSSEIAGLLRKDYWGMRYATEAMGVLIKHAFDQFVKGTKLANGEEFKNIIATCRKDNKASFCLLNNAGFYRYKESQKYGGVRDHYKRSFCKPESGNLP